MSTPKTLTASETCGLMDYLFSQMKTSVVKRRSTRNYLIVCLMLDAGLRLNETRQLLISDLWINEEPRHSLLIREEIAKNRHVRIIPLSSRIREAIHLAHRRLWTGLKIDGGWYAFTSFRENQPISARQIQLMLGETGKKVIGRWINPHMLRHTFGTRLMRTCSARVAQELLGHKHITTTQIYQHPNEDDKVKAIQNIETASEK